MNQIDQTARTTHTATSQQNWWSPLISWCGDQSLLSLREKLVILSEASAILFSIVQTVGKMTLLTLFFYIYWKLCTHFLCSRPKASKVTTKQSRMRKPDEILNFEYRRNKE